MKVYLVGGAVRDQLLGYPVCERDWVVIGGTPDEMIQQGFTQVGRDFPVFLHPQTKEEYALARTERKLSAGYYGFACDFNPNVTLEEDLARRDLTINAMALDDDGALIDPYHGLDDLHSKYLRHVSPAFIEDPVRVLRVARFAARYHHLGFTLADETCSIMSVMVKNGELSHLVPERVWQEFYRSLSERNPEQFILILRRCGALHVVIPELEELLIGHQDSSALNALTNMVAISPDPVLRFAALCYDLDVVNHESMCRRLRIPGEYAHLAQMTQKFYRSIHDLKLLDAESIVYILETSDSFRRPQLFEQLLIVCDAISNSPAKKQAKNWLLIRDKCGKISAQSLIALGFQGKDIKNGLHQKRVDCVEAWKIS